MGTYPGLTPPMLDYIADSIREFVDRRPLIVRYLVTGHTGFKGAWLTLWLAEQGHEVVRPCAGPASRAASSSAPESGSSSRMTSGWTSATPTRGRGHGRRSARRRPPPGSPAAGPGVLRGPRGRR